MAPPLISIAVISVAICAIIVNAAPPKIDPNYSTLYILEGRGVNMTCTGASDTKWEKDGNSVTDFGFKRTKKFEVGMGGDETALTISKAKMSAADSGTYSCTAGSENRNIYLKVVSVTLVNADYNRTMGTATLACTISNVEPSEYTLNWLYKDKVVEKGDKYKFIKENNTMIIMDPAHKDTGEYFCEINFSDKKQSITVPVNFFAYPYVKTFDKSKNLIQGDPLTLHCEVHSYPPAQISWFKDEKPVDQLDGITVSDDETTGLKNGLLKISTVQFEDKGNYMCVAENKYFNMSANRTILVRVKDKLAALWPFLGIVAEVVVLCVIIFIYEKKRSRSEEEEEAADAGNCANAADHKGKDEVRQRNVRA